MTNKYYNVLGSQANAKSGALVPHTAMVMDGQTARGTLSSDNAGCETNGKASAQKIVPKSGFLVFTILLWWCTIIVTVAFSKISRIFGRHAHNGQAHLPAFCPFFVLS